MKEEVGTGGGGGSGGSSNGGWARMCDSCRGAACTVYCLADSAYLCAGCDSRIHAANQVASRHERVWVCEACERAPAAFTCKADAAVLCTSCDADIHSANPLARRHHRVPVLPISGCLYGPSATNPVRPMEQEANVEDGFMVSGAQEGDEDLDEDDDETASWLLLNPPVKNGNNNNNNNNQSNNGFLFGGEVDEYLDLVGYNSSTENQYNDQYNHQQHHHYGVQQKNNNGSDSVVPVHGMPTKEQQLQHQQQHNLQLEMEYEASKSGFGYAASLSHSVSFSSMDASVVPEATMSDISNSHSRPPKGTIDLFSSPPLPMPPQFTPMDREARVLRYREKRKTRKFEKTIRYASRKAYAETRPRIKGRFAKRTDVEVEVDQLFSTTIMAESGYRIVPSF
ncbi:zinc finger protein CONSTANS-LIKE 2 [Telopea speciosissima]|uniref:zinc finger protein CONSTANS-LIKE 2 n=1 Tax=Telopea speciosissima TaxID=54955 RepID=UPI001CC6563A|nr:zinc finger protein CONSTANS-LIKE 2 [Telopea speciosissima]